MRGAAAVTPTDVIAAVALAVVIGGVAVERCWLLARTGSARLGSLGTAAVMGSGAILVGVVVTALERWLWPVLGQFAPPPLADATGSHPLVEVAVVFVAWDVAGFAHHWIGHRTRPGWASHQVHHSGAHYDLSLAWRQSWLPWPALVTFPFVALTGGSFSTAVGCAAVSNAWQGLIHTSAPVAVPRWLASVVMTPTTHRRHHADGGAVNLGPVLTCWDRAVGTWDPRPVEESQLPTPGPSNPLAVELAGWRALLRRPRPPAGAASAAEVICASTPDRAGLVALNQAEQRGLKLACRSRSRPRTARCSATSSSRRWPTSAPSVRCRTRSGP